MIGKTMLLMTMWTPGSWSNMIKNKTLLVCILPALSNILLLTAVALHSLGKNTGGKIPNKTDYRAQMSIIQHNQH